MTSTEAEINEDGGKLILGELEVRVDDWGGVHFEGFEDDDKLSISPETWEKIERVRREFV
jgi:hypothetical protein